MQLLPRKEDLRVKQALIPWAPHATNAPALRSLLLQQGDHQTQLYVHHQPPPNCSCSDHCQPTGASVGSSYVVVKLPHQQRFMLIGNAQANPDYQHACHSIIHTLLPQQEGPAADPQHENLSSHHQQAASESQQQQRKQQVVRLRAVPTAALQQVRTAFSKAGYEESYCSSGLQYIVADDSLKQQLLAPGLQQQLLEQIGSEQYEFGDLQPEDAEYVNENWIYRAPGSLSQIQQVIANDSRHTSCIRQLPDRQLVSWALEMEAGYLGVLHTVEQHRRKGLGRVVLLDLLSKLYKAYLREDVEVQQRLAECGAVSAVSCCACSQNGSCSSCTGCKLQDRSEGLGTDAGGSCWPGGAAYCYVMQGNRPSVALLESVGLVRSQECWWMGFEKK